MYDADHSRFSFTWIDCLNNLKKLKGGVGLWIEISNIYCIINSKEKLHMLEEFKFLSFRARIHSFN